MEDTLHRAIDWLLVTLALPEIGLSAVFLVSLVSATLLPMGSEPAVFGYVKLAPHMFWPTILIATAGNTLGGAISYAMGLGAKQAAQRWQAAHHGHEEHASSEQDVLASDDRWSAKARRWLHRLGAKALLLSWLPAVGDPLCAVAGWLRLPFWPCVFYMAIGKFGRYLAMTAFLLWAAKDL